MYICSDRAQPKCAQVGRRHVIVPIPTAPSEYFAIWIVSRGYTASLSWLHGVSLVVTLRLSRGYTASLSWLHGVSLVVTLRLSRVYTASLSWLHGVSLVVTRRLSRGYTASLSWLHWLHGVSHDYTAPLIVI